jgi:hypothetical protein
MYRNVFAVRAANVFVCIYIHVCTCVGLGGGTVGGTPVARIGIQTFILYLFVYISFSIMSDLFDLLIPSSMRSNCLTSCVDSL